MTCRTTNGEHTVKADGENCDPNPHFRCQINGKTNIIQNKEQETSERKDLSELRGHIRDHPVLRKKKCSYDLRDDFHTLEAQSSNASSSPATSNVTSPDTNKVTSADEIIGAVPKQQAELEDVPAQQPQKDETEDLTPYDRESSSDARITSLMAKDDSRPHDKTVPEHQTST